MMGMKSKYLLLLMCALPVVAYGADRGARVGVSRMSLATVHGPNSSVNLKNNASRMPTVTTSSGGMQQPTPQTPTPVTPTPAAPERSSDCRDAYRACMDEFCLLDESEGYRCACSSNINRSKSLILEIQKIQEEADKLYTEGVEREQLGAKAKLVFGESEAAKKSFAASGVSFSQWLNSDGTVSEGSLGDDADIGDNLYAMASEYCRNQLESCGKNAEMEETLYARQVVSDCKSFEAYLKDQKTNAVANKRTAESAVRRARLEMLDTTNRYNRGECLLAYRSCIADKGGCGANFENCLDEKLLNRRANACENVLDQCMAVRSYVLKDWKDESEMILAEAKNYSDRNFRLTCLARIQDCLEEGCSTSTNSACLTNIEVAAGICPVINECEREIKGIKATVEDKLAYLRVRFCQNDVDKCLREKCGENFTAPECVGKGAQEIIDMCPREMFPSCKNETQYDIIVSAVLLQLDYQLLQGCVNHFAEQLGRTCGTDMSCLPSNDFVMGLTTLPEDTDEMIRWRNRVRNESKLAVDNFFVDFEKDKTVAACQSIQTGGKNASVGDTIFNTAKIIAEIGAENRAMRELESKIAELSRKEDLEKARQNCLTTYQVETPEEGKKNYSYIRSVSFEPDVRNCHVCRMQQVCETGGESKGAAAMKGLAGGLTSGASMGTMVSPGWGSAIGAAAGGLLGGVMGAVTGGTKEFCQELESCEDINM